MTVIADGRQMKARGLNIAGTQPVSAPRVMPFSFRTVLASLPVVIPLLMAAWFSARKGIYAAVPERRGCIGSFPVVVNRPER